MPIPVLFDAARRQLYLGQELGRGGEGAVYELRDRPGLAVKLYQKPLDQEKSAKIAAMAKFGNERLLKLTAWPIEPIRIGSVTGPAVGFLMPKISGHKQAFNLYSPKLRLREFPTASWRFLIRSAANAARAFAVVHESGHVIGDVKHDNLLIGGQATVRLVDCDSYQITGSGSRWFCEVGTPTHQPPELQNVRTYKGLVRTPNHDNFGLAVIIFQMLFMARHPFSGRFLGTGEMPMERAISEYRFVYGSNAAAIQMERPPASLDLNGVTRNLALLFERAFSRQGSQPNGRPRPDEWVAALQDLEHHLKTCGVNPAHHFLDTLSYCPWCQIEAATSVPLFQVVVVGSSQTGFTIAALWAKVNSVPNPGPHPALPSVVGRTVALSPTATALQQATFRAKLAAGLLALIGVTSRIQSMKKEIQRKAAEALAQWQNLRKNWDSYNSSEDFQNIMSDLQGLRNQYDALPQKRLQELQKLESNRYRLQLNAHLDQCRILHARIKGVGVAKKANLQSYGIETAADILDHRVLAVPGFGPTLLSNLKHWRDQQERRFVFDPNKEVDQVAKNAVERQILTEKVDLERKLNDGPSKLIVSSNHILTRRRALLAQAQQAADDLAQAEADLRASSAISPIASWKPAVAAIGAITVGGVVIASLVAQGPSGTAPRQMPEQVQPRGVKPLAAFPMPRVEETLPPHVMKDASGHLRPADGYAWLNRKLLIVRWMPGKMSQEYPHVFASDTEGEWQPGDGYDWVLSPPRPGDMRVKPVLRSEDQFSVAVPESSFKQGLADRTEWEQWITALSGDFRRGAEWWASHRSLRNPGSCSGPTATSQEFVFGCEAAKTRLAPVDVKRKSDPEYRQGWNSYTGSIEPSPAPNVQVSPVERGGTIDIPQDPDSDTAERLNAQELKGLRDNKLSH